MVIKKENCEHFTTLLTENLSIGVSCFSPIIFSAFYSFIFFLFHSVVDPSDLKHLNHFNQSPYYVGDQYVSLILSHRTREPNAT